MNIYEQLAKIADDLYGEGPEMPYDNGGTKDGWNMACRKIAEEIRCLDMSAGAESDLATQALETISRTIFSGHSSDEAYISGNRHAHETCARMAKAALEVSTKKARPA